MMNEIQEFMNQAVADQVRTAGETITISRPKAQNVSFTASAVITSRDGTLDAEVGGAVYSITGHALI